MLLESVPQILLEIESGKMAAIQQDSVAFSQTSEELA